MHVFAHAGSWLQAGPEGCWRYRGNRIFVLFDRPVKLYLGSRLSHMSAWNASWSGSIMCTGGWAKEDPRKWSVSCCDTRCLFLNIFYPINRSSSMLFTIHFFCYASLVYPFLRSSLWTMRDKRQSPWCVIPPVASREVILVHQLCISGYAACDHSRCAMKPVCVELLVWNQELKSFSTKK